MKRGYIIPKVVFFFFPKDEDLLLFRDMYKRKKNDLANLFLLFADNALAAKARSTLIRSASPNQKPKIATKNATQIGKQNASSIEKNTRFATTTMIKMIKSNTSIDHKERSNTLPSIATRTTKQRDTSLNFLASNLSKTMGMESSSTRPKSRPLLGGRKSWELSSQDFMMKLCLISRQTGHKYTFNLRVPPRLKAEECPLMGGRKSWEVPGFSDETPPNLRTDRSLSASRDRPNQSTNQRSGSSSSSSSSSSLVPITKPIRQQSCSPSVTRGRMQEISTSSTKSQQGNGTTLVLGRKMVDKFMNARKSIHEEKEINKAKLNGSMNESSGVGRHISRISANMTLKHMEIHQDSGNSGKNGTTTGRKSSNLSRIPSA
ncbi:hypothetical protein RND71_025205 [Anisodus tanguticus]|uniref:Uncharacterized protein n=1 Tax=Anisodus tanguticus TaxID=243964 RepID=A0AAE1RPI9_9SOLA|nr:hypothetical protein RND71_025205 [Anisodus tanguticus]